MKLNKEGVIAAVEIANKIAKSKSVQKWLFGTYADGQPRSMVDSFAGETLSPKEQKKLEKKYGKKKKKHKKRKKLNF